MTERTGTWCNPEVREWGRELSPILPKNSNIDMFKLSKFLDANNTFRTYFIFYSSSSYSRCMQKGYSHVLSSNFPLQLTVKGELKGKVDLYEQPVTQKNCSTEEQTSCGVKKKEGLLCCSLALCLLFLCQWDGCTGWMEDGSAYVNQFYARLERPTRVKDLTNWFDFLLQFRDDFSQFKK